MTTFQIDFSLAGQTRPFARSGRCFFVSEPVRRLSGFDLEESIRWKWGGKPEDKGVFAFTSVRRLFFFSGQTRSGPAQTLLGCSSKLASGGRSSSGKSHQHPSMGWVARSPRTFGRYGKAGASGRFATFW